jgi:hypothetical protein
MQGAGLATMTREGSSACRVDAVHPIFQLDLTRRLNKTRYTMFFSYHHYGFETNALNSTKSIMKRHRFYVSERFKATAKVFKSRLPSY